MYGMIGTHVTCEGCGLILANRRDEDAAPTDHADPGAWADEGSFVTPGAEAADPADDELFLRRRAGTA